MLNLPLIILRGMTLSAAPESTIMPRAILILRPPTVLASVGALILGVLASAVDIIEMSWSLMACRTDRSSSVMNPLVDVIFLFSGDTGERLLDQCSGLGLPYLSSPSLV